MDKEGERERVETINKNENIWKTTKSVCVCLSIQTQKLSIIIIIIIIYLMMMMMMMEKVIERVNHFFLIIRF